MSDLGTYLDYGSTEISDDLNPERTRQPEKQEPSNERKKMLTDMLATSLEYGRATARTEGLYADEYGVPREDIIPGADRWLQNESGFTYDELIELLEVGDMQDGIDWAWSLTGAPSMQLDTVSNVAAFANPFSAVIDYGHAAWDLASGNVSGARDAWDNIGDRLVGYDPNPYGSQTANLLGVHNWQDAIWAGLDVVDIASLGFGGEIIRPIRQAMAGAAKRQGRPEAARAIERRLSEEFAERAGGLPGTPTEDADRLVAAIVGEHSDLFEYWQHLAEVSGYADSLPPGYWDEEGGLLGVLRSRTSPAEQFHQGAFADAAAAGGSELHEVFNQIRDFATKRLDELESQIGRPKGPDPFVDRILPEVPMETPPVEWYGEGQWVTADNGYSRWETADGTYMSSEEFVGESYTEADLVEEGFISVLGAQYPPPRHPLTDGPPVDRWAAEGPPGTPERRPLPENLGEPIRGGGEGGTVHDPGPDRTLDTYQDIDIYEILFERGIDVPENMTHGDALAILGDDYPFWNQFHQGASPGMVDYDPVMEYRARMRELHEGESTFGAGGFDVDPPSTPQRDPLDRNPGAAQREPFPETFTPDEIDQIVRNEGGLTDKEIRDLMDDPPNE